MDTLQPYDSTLRRLLRQIASTGDIPSSSMWSSIYSNLWSIDDGVSLIRGSYAEFVRECPHEDASWIVALYDTAIVSLRYTNMDDAIALRKFPKCPITAFGIKPIDLGTSTIDALETLWERYIGINGDQVAAIPGFTFMMTELMLITLHMEWAGYSGFATFDRKWNQLKEWKQNNYISPLAGDIMEWLVLNNSHFSIFMPIELRKRLYKELEEVYTTDVLEADKQESLLRLSYTVLADDGVDETFKVSFRRHTGDQNGNEA